MKKLNQCLSLFLVFTMFASSFPANAIQPIIESEPIKNLARAEEEDLVPQNPPGTAQGVQCSIVDQTPNPINGVCCVGLEKNALGKCDEPAFNDTTLVRCTSGADCSGGTGCFPQSSSDLFSSVSPSTEEEEILSGKKLELEAQLHETRNPKTVGAICIHAKDCVSYSCRAGICEDKKVCRFAGAGEFASATINCAKDLIKKPNGMCEVDPNAKNPIYLGLLSESTVQPLGKCEFRLDEESRKKSIVAMQSLRAMEFFLSTISVPAEKECFQVIPNLKNEIAAPFLTMRKNILSNFTDQLNQIEFDYKQLLDASKKYEYSNVEGASGDKNPKQLTIHKDEAISDKDLATRQTSGYDNLMMMYRRNILFQSYEKSMRDTVKTANVKVSGLSKGMGDWKDDDTSWNNGTKSVAAYNCEGSKYQKKKFFGSWKTHYYDQVKDRWSVHYEVSGSAADNANIVKRHGVAEVLKLIGGKATKEEAITEFTKPKYYLIDPMLYSGMAYMGPDKPLKSKSSFLGLFGGFRDLHKAYYIKGDFSASYKKMHTDLQPKIKEFYRSLKINPNQKGFVYEPELLTTEAKDCLDNPADPSKCEKFQPFLDSVNDEAFAHFLAYSYSNKDSYQGFFSNATTYRRRLLAKIEVDMQNISKYYETIISHRDKQNECIEKVINGLADSGILESDNDGLSEGGSFFDPTKGVKQPVVNTSRKATSGIRKMSPLSRTKFQLNLASSPLNRLGKNSMMDNVATFGDTSAKGGIDSTQSAFLAARKDAMLNANSKASAAGINVAAKEKAVMDSINSLARSNSDLGSGPIAGPTGAKGSSAFGFGDGTGKASVSDDSAPKNEVSGDKAADTAAGTIGVGGTTGAGDLSGIGAEASTAAGDSGSGAAASAANDGTGLSDSENEKLMSEYERTKGDYQGSEEDGIFSKVSKAYVRNLDKVLIKKKKIDP
jgi:hypothetical protein